MTHAGNAVGVSESETHVFQTANDLILRNNDNSLPLSPHGLLLLATLDAEFCPRRRLLMVTSEFVSSKREAQRIV